MPSFGISAFLRIVHMNERPQRTELRRRTVPREGGYDFHSSLRRLCRCLMDGEPLESLLTATFAIAQPPERQSAQLGLQRLNAWRILNPGEVLEVPAISVRSPGETFSVKFTPNFGLGLRTNLSQYMFGIPQLRDWSRGWSEPSYLQSNPRINQRAMDLRT